MSDKSTPYPAGLTVDYPEKPLDQVTTLLRLFTAIPIVMLLAMVSGGVIEYEIGDAVVTVSSAGGILFLATAAMIVFRQKYPRWWFDWNAGLSAFSFRVMSYLALLRDEYPSTDEEQAVHVRLEYPDARQGLDRWMPLFKWFLAIPHYIVLAFLLAGSVVAVIAAWFVIVFTGRYPRALFDFVVGTFRWGFRVMAYAFLLVTDDYPPFSLD